MFIFADKTNNIYEMPAVHNEKPLKNSITKMHRKAPAKLANSIDLEAKLITKNLKLADQIEKFTKAEAFITLKDHKDSFINNPTCRLINPSKNELGKISKNILVQINKDIAHNQWKNTSCVIEWFKNINEKNKCAFIQLDIEEFYLSVTEDILENVIVFAKAFISKTDPYPRIVKHCKRYYSLAKKKFFSKEEVWKKKSTKSCFDVTMGSYDGAEIYELAGFYILPHLKTIINKNEMGLYRDDGLLILRGTNGQKTDKTRKSIIEIV